MAALATYFMEVNRDLKNLRRFSRHFKRYIREGDACVLIRVLGLRLIYPMSQIFITVGKNDKPICISYLVTEKHFLRRCENRSSLLSWSEGL